MVTKVKWILVFVTAIFSVATTIVIIEMGVWLNWWFSLRETPSLASLYIIILLMVGFAGSGVAYWAFDHLAIFGLERMPDLDDDPGLSSEFEATDPRSYQHGPEIDADVLEPVSRPDTISVRPPPDDSL